MAQIYAQGVGEVKAYADEAAFWRKEAAQFGMGVETLRSQPRAAFEARFARMDPFGLKVE